MIGELHWRITPIDASASFLWVIARYMKHRCIDIVAIWTVGIAAWCCCDPHTAWWRNNELYVSPDGSDWYLGTNPQWAFATIQHAANRACPGDTIVILPGIYRERIHVTRGGTDDAPITFAASCPGKATITNAVPPEQIRQWKWQEEGDGIYSTVSGWPIYWVLCEDTNLFNVRWGGLRTMRALVCRAHAYPAFCYDNDRLYVFFPNRIPPASQAISTHGKIPPPREWGVLRTANVRCEADHVCFKGFRFELGVGNGILLRKGTCVVVRDCAFNGVETGIGTWRNGPVNGLRVERCFYNNYPQRDWLNGWLSSWGELYAYYSSATLVNAPDDAIIRHNLVVHGADLLRAGCSEGHGIDISENLLAWGTDDAIELYGTSIHFHHNLVYDVHESVSAVGVRAGPVEIDHNLFIHPTNGVNGAQLKLINEHKENGVIRDIHIHHNTFVGHWLCWWTAPVEDIQIYNNVCATQYQQTSAWPPGLTERDNTYITLPATGYLDPGLDSKWFSDQRATNQVTVGVANYRGATPPGRKWRMTRPGPAWLDYSSSPATIPLTRVLASELLSP